MITVITGTPGAGKTLYTIEKLLLPLVGKTVKGQDSRGNDVELPRRIYTNINGLLVDHELIDGGDNQGLRDWHKWAKPGSVIVFDEFQKVWAPRANGSKVPEDIQALDTHRHMGVDFILVTQSVMNTDRHIHALAGRHLHIRRVGNMKAAVVYEWDHVSRSLMYSKAMTKSPWRYSKKVFELYKSAELHTKQPRKMPGLVWFILAGIVAFGVIGPFTVSRLNERTNPDAHKNQVAKASAPGAGATPAAGGAAPAVTAQVGPMPPDERVDFIPRLSDKPWTAPAYDHLRTVVSMPQIAGGVCMSGKCACVTLDGARLDMSDAACSAWIQARPFNPYVQVTQAVNVVGASGGIASAGTPSVRGQTEPAHVEIVTTVPGVSGVSNPRAESLQPSAFPPGSSVHTTPATGAPASMPALSLQNPYRKTS